MKILLSLFTILLFVQLHAQNDYPIVLIHGFMGWGESEMGEYNYWGGNKDYIDMMRNSGNTVFELSVGPVSSNWDRAIEAYYQLKGGQVDYGKVHSKKYNIEMPISNSVYEVLFMRNN